jgi:hypothetical protein
MGRVYAIAIIQDVYEIALQISLKGFLANFGFDAFLGVPLPKPTILILKLLHSLYCLHAESLVQMVRENPTFDFGYLSGDYLNSS